MAASNGSWYVRLPDGRVVLARSTQALRYHIERGRIPANSRVRRSADEKWASLQTTPAFADLMTPLTQPTDGADNNADVRFGAPTPSPDEKENSKNPMGRSSVEYRAFGVQALVTELFNAVDLSLSSRKLWTMASAALIWAVGFIFLELVLKLTQGNVRVGLGVGIGLVLFVSAGFASAAVAQMTLIELLHRRRAHWAEIKPRLVGNACNMLLGQLLFVAVIWLPIQGLRHVPDLFSDGKVPEALEGLVLTLRLVLETLFIPLVGLGQLMASIIVVEECWLLPALKKWWELIRSDLNRIFLYETLAVALGVVLTLPLFIPLVYVGWSQGAMSNKDLATVAQATLHVLGALALTPVMVYLVVANVFIYLNLRYEFYSPGR